MCEFDQSYCCVLKKETLNIQFDMFFLILSTRQVFFITWKTILSLLFSFFFFPISCLRFLRRAMVFSTTCLTTHVLFLSLAPSFAPYRTTSFRNFWFIVTRINYIIILGFQATLGFVINILCFTIGESKISIRAPPYLSVGDPTNSFRVHVIY